LNVEIDNIELNDSANYTGTKPIRFIDNNKTLIEFDWDFATPFDFTGITIEKQPSNSTEGYVVINGLSINKTAYVDEILNSGFVCIKDQEGAVKSDVSVDCDEVNETLLSCPGTNGAYDCSTSNGKLKITGLAHSVIIESTPNSTGCNPNWNCEWSGICSGGMEGGICTDNNFCNDNTNKPNETRTCSDCQSEWICGGWEPETCSLDEDQTRNCSDLNKCASDRVETQECETQESAIKGSTIIIVILILLLVGAIVAGILYLINKKADNANPAGKNQPPVAPQPPTNPGTIPEPVAKQMQRAPKQTPRMAPAQ